MHNHLSDSFCFNLRVIDSYYHSVIQEVCFSTFSDCELVFQFCVVPVKNVKNGNKFCCLCVIFRAVLVHGTGTYDLSTGHRTAFHFLNDENGYFMP